jgi:hypothetical protein
MPRSAHIELGISTDNNNMGIRYDMLKSCVRGSSCGYYMQRVYTHVKVERKILSAVYWRRLAL